MRRGAVTLTTELKYYPGNDCAVRPFRPFAISLQNERDLLSLRGPVLQEPIHLLGTRVGRFGQ